VFRILLRGFLGRVSDAQEARGAVFQGTVPRATSSAVVAGFRRLQIVEQRRRKVTFGKRWQDDDDIFAIHPRTLADLHRRRDRRPR
jgi:hypothetical protein